MLERPKVIGNGPSQVGFVRQTHSATSTRGVRDRPVPCSVAHRTGKAPKGNKNPVTHAFAGVGTKSAGILSMEDVRKKQCLLEKGAPDELV